MSEDLQPISAFPFRSYCAGLRKWIYWSRKPDDSITMILCSQRPTRDPLTGQLQVHMQAEWRLENGETSFDLGAVYPNPTYQKPPVDTSP